MANSTTTVFQDWDERWRTEMGRIDCLVPDQEVSLRARAALDSGPRRSLGLACGIGRHALALADIGLKVNALDVSQTGSAEVSAIAEKNGLSVSTHIGNRTKLLLVIGFYDFLKSWNVIYHGDEPALRQAIEEIYRVLCPGGTMLVMMLSKRNADFGIGRNVSKNLRVHPHAEAGRAHPHYFCDARKVADLFSAFGIRSLVDLEQRRKPGNGNWHIVTERT